MPETDTAHPTQVLVRLQPEHPPDAERATLLALAASLTPITSDEEFRRINNLDAKLTAFIDREKPPFDQSCNDAYKAHSSACALRAKFFAPIETLRTKTGTLLKNWNIAREQKRRDEEARLTAVAQQDQVQHVERTAQLYEAQGQPEVAAAVRATPPPPAPIVALPKADTPEDLSFADKWKWRPIGASEDEPRDKDALKRMALVAPRKYLTVDVAAVTAEVNHSRGTVTIEGALIYQDQDRRRKRGK